MPLDFDTFWMARALRLGDRGLGTTAENPSVGCVLVKEGRLIGVGWTQPGGRPHAEVMALAAAGPVARGATAYVTLEPCSHHGRTGPCADALIAAGVARVVAAMIDPNPAVAGQGLARLRAAGIEAETGTGEAEARAAHAGFISRITRKRPYIILKLAVSADGKIAGAPGQRTRITGPESQARVHLLRAQCDAILVGMATVIADDPELTVRLPGLEERSPLPVVIGRGAIPQRAKLEKKAAILDDSTSISDGRLMASLAAKGINRLLVEGGAKTARAFLDAGLVDEAQIFTSPLRIGPQGVDAINGISLESALTDFRLTAQEMLGEDRLSVYVKR